jgi:hypothetical protein
MKFLKAIAILLVGPLLGIRISSWLFSAGPRLKIKQKRLEEPQVLRDCEGSFDCV